MSRDQIVSQLLTRPPARAITLRTSACTITMCGESPRARQELLRFADLPGTCLQLSLNHESFTLILWLSAEVGLLSRRRPLAIVFELSAECSGTSDCVALVKHFDGLQMTLLTGRTISWKASEVDHSTAMSAHSPDLSMYGVRTLQDALELTESGIRLYHHLRNGPAFRFARVALEAGLIELAELRHWVAPMADGECRFEIECAVDESLYRELGSPQFCYPFRDGYWWTRYRGEQYLPLYSNDQSELNAMCRSLFPEYFGY